MICLSCSGFIALANGRNLASQDPESEKRVIVLVIPIGRQHDSLGARTFNTHVDVLMCGELTETEGESWDIG